MEVFESSGKEGWLKVCVDNGEVICLNFKNKIQVSVSYMSEDNSNSDSVADPNCSTIQKTGNKTSHSSVKGEKESDSADPLDEELNGLIEKVKHAKGEKGLLSNAARDFLSENRKGSAVLSQSNSENNENSSSENLSGYMLQESKKEDVKEELETDIEDAASIEDNEQNFADNDDDDTYLTESEIDLPCDSKGKKGIIDDKAEKKIKASEDQGSDEGDSEDAFKTDTLSKKNEKSDSGTLAVNNRGSVMTDKAASGTERGEKNLEILSTSGMSRRKQIDRKAKKPATIYKCNICSGEFTDGYSLTSHQRAQNTKETCSICDLECMSKAYLIMHQHLMHSNAVWKRENCCPLCKKPFSKQSDILIHIRSEHTNEGLYRCCVCHSLFQNYQSFNLHLDYFTKHKTCGKEKMAKAPSSQSKKTKDCDRIITKPLSVVLTKLPRKKIESLTGLPCKDKSPSAKQLTSLMNFQAPKPEEPKRSSVSPSGRTPALPDKRRMGQPPLKRPLNRKEPPAAPMGQGSMKRPLDQMIVRRPVDPKLMKKQGELMLMRRPGANPLKRPLSQSQLRRTLGQPSLKKPFGQTPLDQILGKRVLNQPLSKKLQQLPMKRPGDLTHLRKQLSSSLHKKKPLPQSSPNSHPSTSKPGSDNAAAQRQQSKSALRKSRKSAWNKLWKCHFCERVFRTKGDYIGHKKPSRLIQTCTECGFASTSKALYLIHRYQKHTNYNNDRYTILNKDLRCHICEEPVALNEVLSHVMSKHTGEHPYECCVCKTPSKTYEEWVSHGKCHLRTTEEKNSLKERNKLLQSLSVKMGVPERSDQVFCNLCKSYFMTEKEFVSHHKPESVQKECEICKVICHSEAGYIIHKYISHGLSPGEQNETAVADLPTSLSGDFKMWHEDDAANDNSTESTKCPTCSEMFPMKDLLSHVMAAHTQESAYKCCTCQTTIPDWDQYISHCDFHLGKKLYPSGTQRCLICGLRFDARFRLARHKLMHKPSCPFCHIEFGSKILLEVHLKNLHTNDMTACTYCNKLFADMTRLAEHERNHFFYKKSPCPTCGLMVTNLTKHIARRHPKTDTPELECRLCGSKFPMRADLQRHMHTHNNNRYECDICKKTFKRQSGLRRHAQSHLKVRKFHECHICGKKCSQRNNLSVHMRIHASTKAFTCEHCGQGFNYNQSLQTHIRKKHTAPATTPTSSSTSNANTGSSSGSASAIFPAPVSAPASATSSPASSSVLKPEPPGLAAMEVMHTMDNSHPRVMAAPPIQVGYPEHPVYPDPSQHFYPDPSGYIPVNTLQQSYTNLITSIVRSEQDPAQVNQQQGYPIFYQQF